MKLDIFFRTLYILSGTARFAHRSEVLEPFGSSLRRKTKPQNRKGEAGASGARFPCFPQNTMKKMKRINLMRHIEAMKNINKKEWDKSRLTFVSRLSEKGIEVGDLLSGNNPNIPDDLTERELFVLSEWVAGKTFQEIGASLGITREGSRWIRKKAMEKMGIEIPPAYLEKRTARKFRAAGEKREI